MLNITAKINGIRYNHIIKSELCLYSIDDIDNAICNTSFRLQTSPTCIYNVSRWVSPKRTRSYPYVNVFNTLHYNDGKKVTIIPVIKDEGLLGDRDYIQWDTISLMSLLGVYTILAYYSSAESNLDLSKITQQKFDCEYISDKLTELDSYRSDALHWNMAQARLLPEIMNTALDRYDRISEQTGVTMHSRTSARTRIQMFQQDFTHFSTSSREMARIAQSREANTIHQGESVIEGLKSTVTIQNFLGGEYYLTADEAYIEAGRLILVEAKHTSNAPLPSTGDIIDGLVKMIIFCNLEEVSIDGVEYQVIPRLKLTHLERNNGHMSNNKKAFLATLHEEALQNNFEVRIESC